MCRRDAWSEYFRSPDNVLQSMMKFTVNNGIITVWAFSRCPSLTGADVQNLQNGFYHYVVYGTCLYDTSVVYNFADSPYKQSSSFYKTLWHLPVSCLLAASVRRRISSSNIDILNVLSSLREFAICHVCYISYSLVIRILPNPADWTRAIRWETKPSSSALCIQATSP